MKGSPVIKPRGEVDWLYDPCQKIARIIVCADRLYLHGRPCTLLFVSLMNVVKVSSQPRNFKNTCSTTMDNAISRSPDVSTTHHLGDDFSPHNANALWYKRFLFVQ